MQHLSQVKLYQLNLVNQVQVVGKESMLQVLRIISTLELVIPEIEEVVD